MGACAHAHVLAGVHRRRTLSCLPDSPKKANCEFGVSGTCREEGKGRTTALCAGEVNRQVGFLCSSLLKASFYFFKVRGGACGRRRLDCNPQRGSCEFCRGCLGGQSDSGSP